jgi:hypothetical protein
LLTKDRPTVVEVVVWLRAMAIVVKTPTISAASDDCGRSMDRFAS